MPKTAKLFRNGRSQAVRLPSEYRFEGSEVFVRRDPATGDVILTCRKIFSRIARTRLRKSATCFKWLSAIFWIPTPPAT